MYANSAPTLSVCLSTTHPSLTHTLSLYLSISPLSVLQMGMMGNAGPYGGPYGQAGGQGLGGAGLAPQLQNKAGMSNSLAQFSMDKKPQPGMQGMGAMVSATWFVG